MSGRGVGAAAPRAAPPVARSPPRRHPGAAGEARPALGGLPRCNSAYAAGASGLLKCICLRSTPCAATAPVPRLCYAHALDSAVPVLLTCVDCRRLCATACGRHLRFHQCDTVLPRVAAVSVRTSHRLMVRPSQGDRYGWWGGACVCRGDVPCRARHVLCGRGGAGLVSDACRLSSEGRTWRFRWSDGVM